MVKILRVVPVAMTLSCLFMFTFSLPRLALRTDSGVPAYLGSGLLYCCQLASTGVADNPSPRNRVEPLALRETESTVICHYGVRTLKLCTTHSRPGQAAVRLGA